MRGAAAEETSPRRSHTHFCAHFPAISPGELRQVHIGGRAALFPASRDFCRESARPRRRQPWFGRPKSIALPREISNLLILFDVIYQNDRAGKDQPPAGNCVVGSRELREPPNVPSGEALDQSTLVVPGSRQRPCGEAAKRQGAGLTPTNDSIHKVRREVGERQQPAGVPVTESLQPGQLKGADDLTGRDSYKDERSFTAAPYISRAGF